jgi:hypothetical protein
LGTHAVASAAVLISLWQAHLHNAAMTNANVSPIFVDPQVEHVNPAFLGPSEVPEFADVAPPKVM